MFKQIEGEIEGLFDFMEQIYGLFGFTFKLTLSTRPETFLGKIETWDAAEKVRTAVHRYSGGRKIEVSFSITTAIVRSARKALSG